MIMCILFLFDGEKIIRGIFNINSSTKSLGDMAAAGAMAWGVAKKVGGIFDSKDKGEKDDGKEKDADKQAQKDRKKATPKVGETRGAEANKAATKEADTGKKSGDVKVTPGGVASGPGITGGSAGAGTSSGSTNNDEVKLGRDESSGKKSLYDTISKDYDNRMESKKKAGIISGFLDGDYDEFHRGIWKGTGKLAGGANSILGQAAGSAVGLTLGMAQADGQKGAETIIGTTLAGRELGKGISEGVNTAVGDTINGISSRREGKMMAAAYMAGEYDKELGIDKSELDRIADEDLRKKKEEAFNKIRERAAEIARLKSKGRNNKAEILSIQEMIDRENKD